MKKTVNRLFQLRQALDECEKEFGLSGYSEADKTGKRRHRQPGIHLPALRRKGITAETDNYCHHAKDAGAIGTEGRDCPANQSSLNDNHEDTGEA